MHDGKWSHPPPVCECKFFFQSILLLGIIILKNNSMLLILDQPFETFCFQNTDGSTQHWSGIHLKVIIIMYTQCWQHLLFLPAVTCGLPPIPNYSQIIFDKKPVGNIFEFGFGGRCECSPHLAMFGDERAYCQANGRWTEPPECRRKWKGFRLLKVLHTLISTNSSCYTLFVSWRFHYCERYKEYLGVLKVITVQTEFSTAEYSNPAVEGRSFSG